MSIKFYQYKDARNIVAPFGVFSDVDLQALFNAKNTKGRPLGRNCIRFWLYLLTRASGRKRQGYEVSQANIKECVGLSKSSAYEALNDLIFAGFLTQPIPDKKEYFLSCPVSDSLKPRNKSLKPRTTYQDLSKDSPNKLPLTPTRGMKEKNDESPMERKGTLACTIQEIIESTPWLIAGSIQNSKEEMKNTLLESDADVMINNLVVRAHDSLLRNRGYHGTLRKRVVRIELEAVLNKLHRGVISITEWNEPKKTDSFPSYPPLEFPNWFNEKNFTAVGCDDFWMDKVREWRKKLKEKMGSQYSIWLAPLSLDIVDVNDWPNKASFIAVLCTCPNRHFLEWVKEHYYQSISDATISPVGIPMTLLFVLTGWSGSIHGPGG